MDAQPSLGSGGAVGDPQSSHVSETPDASMMVLAWARACDQTDGGTPASLNVETFKPTEGTFGCSDVAAAGPPRKINSSAANNNVRNVRYMSPTTGNEAKWTLL